MPIYDPQELRELDLSISSLLEGIELPEHKYLDTEWLEVQSEELRAAKDKLYEYLCGEFIASNGQHSDNFYRARRLGFKLVTLEKDSFGPLVSGYASLDGKWKISYG